MLIWIHGDCEIQNGTHRKSDDACYQSTCHGRLLALVKVPLSRYLCRVYRLTSGRTGEDPKSSVSAPTRNRGLPDCACKPHLNPVCNEALMSWLTGSPGRPANGQTFGVRCG